MSGFIKIDRKILDWEWWSDKNTSRLFFYMIMKANWTEGRFQGITIPKGSFVSSLDKLAGDTNLTINEVRTALKHLKSTGEVTSKAHSKFTVFTVTNYCIYQEDNTEVTSKSQADNKQTTSKSQTDNKQITTIEEEKEEKKEKNTICASEADALFEKLWKLYPVKKGKGKVSLAARQHLLKVGYEEMVRAIDRYLLELEKDSDWRKPQNGSTFFHSGYIDYLDKNYEPSKRVPSKEQKKSNSFLQFPQNNYDYDQLEKELLSN